MEYLRKRVRCAVGGACRLGWASFEIVLEDGVEDQAVAKDLVSLVFGEGFAVFEDFRVEQLLVGCGGFQEGLRALGVVLESCLVELQGLLDLDLLRVVDLILVFVVRLDIEGVPGRRLGGFGGFRLFPVSVVPSALCAYKQPSHATQTHTMVCLRGFSAILCAAWLAARTLETQTAAAGSVQLVDKAAGLGYRATRAK
jgi:hypothetical protein